MVNRLLLPLLMFLIGLAPGGLRAATNQTGSRSNLSPWDAAATYGIDSPFIGPAGKWLTLGAIVLGGLLFAFAKDDSKRLFAGIVFAIGMLIGAANFLVWLFLF